MKNIDDIQRSRYTYRENRERKVREHFNSLITDRINDIRRDYGLMLEYPVPDKLIHGTGNSPTKSHKIKRR